MYYDNDGPEAWRSLAKCRNHDPELWFPPRDKNLYKTIADKAKGICFGRDGEGECPARISCLLYAESNDEQHGIWGGLSHRERNALRRKVENQGYTLKERVESGKK